MDSNNTPFQSGWYAAGEPWDCDNTYCFVPFDKLPPLNLELFKGEFQWLTDMRKRFKKASSIYSDNIDNLENLINSASNLNLKLPNAFLTFFKNEQLHMNIPTCTSCYLELFNEIVKIDNSNGGYLIRFMNDQQCVLLWYLYIDKEGDHCVVVAHDFYEDELRRAMLMDDYINRKQLIKETFFCAYSFEEFLYRFWIENTLWFCIFRGLRLSKTEKSYLNAIQEL